MEKDGQKKKAKNEVSDPEKWKTKAVIPQCSTDTMKNQRGGTNEDDKTT